MCLPLRGSLVFVCLFQGLTPLAISWRPSGTLKKRWVKRSQDFGGASQDADFLRIRLQTILHSVAFPGHVCRFEKDD